MTEDYLTYGHRIAQYVADTARLTWDVLDSGGNVALRGRAGHAAGHRPRHVSVRDLVEPRLRPRPARAPASARRTSTRSGASPRPTPRASAPARSRPSSTTSSATRCARPAASTARRPGRPRRVGWIDLVALRYAARINCARPPGDHQARRADRPRRRSTSARATAAPRRRRFDHYPYHQTVMHQATGDYEQLPGWDEDITECREERDLPQSGARLPRLHRGLRRRADRADRRRPGPRPGHLDRGGPLEPRRPRRRARLAADHAGVHDEVVERAVLLVPERPQVVDRASDARR